MIKIFVIFLCYFSLLSLSPSSNIGCDTLRQHLLYVDLDCEPLFMLKDMIKVDDETSLHIFHKEHPSEFSLFFNDLLVHAISLNKWDMIIFLLKCEECDISNDVLVQIVWKAVACDQPHVVATIVEIYPDLTIPGSSFMHIAVKWRNMLLVEKIYRYQKDIGNGDFQGKTPLHYAVALGDYGLVKFLCDRHADLYAEDFEGVTPLDIAGTNLRSALSFILLNRPFPKDYADIEKQVRQGVENGDKETVLNLIKAYPVCINKTDRERETLLHHAVREEVRGVIEIIVSRGGNLDFKNRHGDTPLDIAVRKGGLSRGSQTCDGFTPDIYRALRERHYKLFLKYSLLLDLNQEDKVMELASQVASLGYPFIMRVIFYFYLPEAERDKLLKRALDNCHFNNFKKEFIVMRRLRKMSSEVLIDMYKIKPRIVEWVDFPSIHWSNDEKIKLLKFVAQNNSGRSLTLNSYGEGNFEYWRHASCFLSMLFDESSIPFPSLKCPVEGNALSSFINLRCQMQHVSCSKVDEFIFKLMDKGSWVNEDTPIGKPLNHFLYMLSGCIKKLKKKEKEQSLALIRAFLEKYEKKDGIVGMSLNPKTAERLHLRATGRNIEEYMQTVLGSTLHFSCPSQELYDLIKWRVDLEEVNGHRRNFLHHLALLGECLENHCERLFLERQYTVKEMRRHINLQDGDGMTPLMYATCNPGFFRQLILCGADMTLTDKRGFRIDHHLLIHGQDDVIKIFLENKGIPFFSHDEGVILKEKLGIFMDDCFTLDVTFFDQLKELIDPRQIPVGHKESETSYLDVLSTHAQFALRIKRGLDLLIGEAVSYRRKWGLKVRRVPQGEEEEADYQARVFLSTGMSSWLYDGPAFVTETYAFLNLFHICEVYGRYAPDFSYPLRAQSVLLDGFKRVFTQLLKKEECKERWNIDAFKRQLKCHREILLMSQEYVMPLLIEYVCEGHGKISPFFQAICDFLIEERLNLKYPLQKLLKYMILNEGAMESRLKLCVPLIKNDESGVYFPFCYLLPRQEALILKNLLLNEMGTLPVLRPDFKNGVYRNMQALMRTVMRWNVGSYLKKVKAHEQQILKRREALENHSQKVSSFQDVLKILDPSKENIVGEDELMKHIKVNGRSVSFVVDGEEYILKVRKKNEDMRDHAEISCGLRDGAWGIKDNYGSVAYGVLEPSIQHFVHSLILDRSKNPRISLKEDELTEHAVLFKVKHTHYFEYLSDPEIPFDKFKIGLKKTMEQAFRYMREQGRLMETLSDIAHDKSRPGIFLPMVYFLDYVNGVFLGTFLKIIDSCKTVDACEEGLRDLGNILTTIIKKNMAFSVSYATYLENLHDQMKKDGQENELEDMILIDNMQEALGHTLMIGSILMLIRLSDHPGELEKMTGEQFLADLEEVLILPFVKICGLREGVDALRPFYRDMLIKDFEDFKANPHHLEYASSIFRHGDLSRNNYYQSFYQLTYFLMSLMVPADSELSGHDGFQRKSCKRLRSMRCPDDLIEGVKRLCIEVGHSCFESA